MPSKLKPPPNRKRTSGLLIYLYPEERREINAAARAARLSVSDWVRTRMRACAEQEKGGR